MRKPKDLLGFWLVRVTLVAMGYYLAGRLALLLAIPPGFATAVWPAAGVALVALLVWGYGVWPGLVLGSFLTNIWTTLASGGSATGGAIFIASAIGVGAALQGLLGAWLVRRFIGYPNSLVHEGDIVKFLGLGGPVGCLVAATWGVATLRMAGIVSPGELSLNWFTWWVGDTIGVLTCAPLLLVLVGEPRSIWRARSVSVALPTVVAFSLVVVVYIGASQWSQHRIEADFHQRCSERSGAVRKSMDDCSDALHSLGGLLESNRNLTREEFGTFSRHLLTNSEALHGLSWNVLVPDSERSAFEHQVRMTGVPDFQITERSTTGELVPAESREHYVVVHFLEPHGSNERVLGFDVASESVRRTALQRACDSASEIASGPIMLIQNSKNLPGFLVFQPIYHSGTVNETVEQRRTNLRGYATAVFRIRDRIESGLAGFDRLGLELDIWDDDAPVDQRLIYSSAQQFNTHARPAMDGVSLSWSESFEFAGRPRRLVFRTTPEYMAAHRSLEPWSILAGGLLFTSLLCTMFLSQSGRTARIQEVVEDQTADLQRTSDLLSNLNAELAQTSRIDSLTGLLRRQAWEESLTLEHERSLRYGHPYSIVMLDVDHFKKLNDSLGHQHGDQCLRSVAQHMAVQCRRTDLIGRYGGEEFIALLVETPRDGALQWAERLLQVIFDDNLPHPASPTTDRITVSIGLATFDPQGSGQSWEAVIAAADEALYRAKKSGRNCVCAHEPVLASATV